MKRIQIDSVQPGDILFTARQGKISKTIRSATSGVVSHAMICVQYGSFIDSTSDGVQARNLQRELFEDDEQAFHFRLKTPPSQEVLKEIIEYARAEIGVQYSIIEALRSVATVYKPRSKKQFCSRLVARAFKMAGVELVPDADYCSPEDLRCSPLLMEIPIKFESVSDEKLAWMSNRPNPIQATHNAQNAVLDAARSIDSEVESFNDLYGLLVRNPEADQVIAAALVKSGYLELWKMEVEKHPWRYTHGLTEKLSASRQDVRDYCIGTVKEAYSGGIRFAINLVQLRVLLRQHPRQSFCLKIALYETLIRNDQNRREVAYDWLHRHYPDLLKQHMEEIEPHTPYWWSVIDRVEPQLAALSRRQAFVSEGRIDVCSSCGDQPASRYRVVNGAETMPGVPSLRLCDDCVGIRRVIMGNVLMPFLSEPKNCEGK